MGGVSVEHHFDLFPEGDAGSLFPHQRGLAMAPKPLLNAARP
jgi:hypothetical protein